MTPHASDRKEYPHTTQKNSDSPFAVLKGKFNKKTTPSEDKKEGRVKWFNERKGFGFIVMDSGKDIFVHSSSLKKGQTLSEGQRVRFNVSQREKGPSAVDVEDLS